MKDGDSGLAIDVMYRTPAWVDAELARDLHRHEASVGYSTAVWANVRDGIALANPTGWYGALHRRAAVLYPEPLRGTIIAKNVPLLRRARGVYRHQIAKAISRDDPVSVNHRLAAFMASALDVVFATNRLPHPGEKRQLATVEATCPLRPSRFIADVRYVPGAASGNDAGSLVAVDRLAAGIEVLVMREGLWPGDGNLATDGQLTIAADGRVGAG